MITDIILATIIFLYGLLVGSFLNVLIYRIPLGKGVFFGRSYCPNCGSLIPLSRNIPLISYLFLKGRCKDCSAPISLVYPLVELVNGILWLLTWYIMGLDFYSLLLFLLISILIVISFIDLAEKIIPNGLVLSLLILAGINALYQIIFLDAPWHLFLPGFFAASLPLYILGLIYPEGMGGGDIKLMAAAGLFTGWKLILLSLFLAAIYALLYAILSALAGRSVRNVEIPFAPFLSLGILTSIFFGRIIISSYLTLVLAY